MSDGSGGAPQLDERLLEDLQDEIGARFADYWQDAFGQRLSVGRRCDLAALALVSLGADPKQFAWNHVQPRDLSTLPNAVALAASPGAGELDLTDGEVEAVLRNLPDEPGFHLGFGGNFNAAVAKLRARLDRKDDDE